MTSKNKQYPPEAIANNLLWLAHREGIPITPMKLLKLVYIVYGWALALTGRKLFDDPIEAWTWGPVIPRLYGQFQIFGSKPINGFAIDSDPDAQAVELDEPTYPVIDRDDKDALKVVYAVWKHYKRKSAINLSHLTHEPNGAWDIAYKKGPKTRLADQDIIRRSMEGIWRLYGKK